MMASLLGYSGAQLCATVSNSAINGFILFALFTSLQIATSGYLVTKSGLPVPLRWTVYSGFLRWVVGQLMENEFEGFGTLGGYQGTIQLAMYDYENMVFHRSRDVLVGWWFGFQVIVFIAMIKWPSSVPRVTVEQDNALKEQIMHQADHNIQGNNLDKDEESQVGSRLSDASKISELTLLSSKNSLGKTLLDPTNNDNSIRKSFGVDVKTFVRNSFSNVRNSLPALVVPYNSIPLQRPSQEASVQNGSDMHGDDDISVDTYTESEDIYIVKKTIPLQR